MARPNPERHYLGGFSFPGRCPQGEGQAEEEELTEKRAEREVRTAVHPAPPPPLPCASKPSGGAKKDDV